MNESIQQSLLSPEWVAWLSLPQTTIIGQDTLKKNFNKIITNMFLNLLFKKFLTELLDSKEPDIKDEEKNTDTKKKNVFNILSSKKIL